MDWNRHSRVSTASDLPISPISNGHVQLGPIAKRGRRKWVGSSAKKTPQLWLAKLLNGTNQYYMHIYIYTYINILCMIFYVYIDGDENLWIWVIIHIQLVHIFIDNPNTIMCTNMMILDYQKVWGKKAWVLDTGYCWVINQGLAVRYWNSR